MEKILIIGAGGQLGTELTAALRDKFGRDAVVASDIREIAGQDGPFELLDAMDTERLHDLHEKYQFTQIYHLAAILSAKGENDPKWAWRLNMESLMNVLELGRDPQIQRIFWPSSIAASSLMVSPALSFFGELLQAAKIRINKKRLFVLRFFMV